MLTPCLHYAMPFAMTVGGRCGKRLFCTIESNKHSKGRRGLSNERRLYLRLAMPLLRNHLLNLLPYQSLYLLLLLPKLLLKRYLFRRLRQPCLVLQP
jgi:hypothetical protein